MNNLLIIYLLISIVIAGVFFLIYYFNKKTIIKRKLKKATGRKISDFVSGQIAKVVGKVEYLNEPLLAPLSGRPCAYYYIKVEQLVSSGISSNVSSNVSLRLSSGSSSNNSSYWKTIIEEEVAGTFIIRDGKYCAHIGTKYIKSCLVEDRKYSSGFFNDASEFLERYLNIHGYNSEGALGFNKTLRYKEGVLEKGELIAVLGRGEWKNASQIQLDESYGNVLAITSTENEPVYLSDDPDTVRTKYN
jgi:hypothetical protein